MGYDEYARFRGSTDCGAITGTVWTGPQVCGRPPKFTVDGAYSPVVNGRVCGIHARVVRRNGWTVEPLVPAVSKDSTDGE